jgi:hypothetical protein
MGLKTAILVAVLGSLVVPSVELRAAVPQAKSRVTVEYAEALRTADGFLCAWSRRAASEGLPLLSRRLLSEPRADSLERRALLSNYLEGLSNPHHLAFEIATGRERGDSCFVFPVELFESYSGGVEAIRTADSIAVVREPDGWRVDRLPAIGRRR